MKMFQVNIMTLLMLLAVVALGLVLPSLFVQSIWNSLFENFEARNLSIAVWQAALLWGSLLCVLYITGIFKFKIDFKTLDNIDINEINDPRLRDEIERLKQKETNKERAKKEDDKF